MAALTSAGLSDLVEAAARPEARPSAAQLLPVTAAAEGLPRLERLLVWSARRGPRELAPAAEALVRVQHSLAEQGYGLLVHDAYRPWYVTKIFWDATPVDKRTFVADPAVGSRHNRGCAVDLTLYTLRDGQPVVVRDEAGIALVPSVISFHDDGSVLVGTAALIVALHSAMKRAAGSMPSGPPCSKVFGVETDAATVASEPIPRSPEG